jgi:hypothetical protein
MKTMIIGAALASLVSTAAFAEPSSGDWVRIHSAPPAASTSHSAKAPVVEVAPVRLEKTIPMGDHGASGRYDRTAWDADANNG